MIHTGDCVTVMAGMEPDSVDAIVTDPPYGLEFMGKEWDRLGDDPVSKSWDTKGRRENVPHRVAGDPGGRHAVSHKQINPRCRNCGRAVNGRDTVKGFKVCSCDSPDWYQPNTFAVRQQEWHSAWATAALRVAKPGAYLLAFGGTRTVHRMTCALEDAGWIIRDMLVWGYASGFPKSRSLLKPAWEPIVMARKPGPLQPLGIDACRIGYESDDERAAVNARSGPNSRWSEEVERSVALGDKRPHAVEDKTHPAGRWPANIVLTDPVFDGGWDGVVGGTSEQKSGLRVAGTRVKASGPATTATYGDFPDRVADVPTYGDTGTYSRFFALSSTMGTCYFCGVPNAALSSADKPTLDIPLGIAPEPASSHRSSSPSDHAPSAGSRSGEAGASFAPPSAEARGGETSGSRLEPLSTKPTAIGSSTRPEPTTPPTPRSKPPATLPRSAFRSDPVTSAGASATSSGITTTTPGRWTCDACADLATPESIQGGTFSGPRASRGVPADQPDYARFLLIPKAARSDREPNAYGRGALEPAVVRTQGRVDGRTVNGDGTITSHGDTRRARRNLHPTVKPVDLMRHLVRLVTPPGAGVRAGGFPVDRDRA